jgi:hypothetical protein
MSHKGNSTENTIDGLDEHCYGDTPITKFHNEVINNEIAVRKMSQTSFLVRLFGSSKTPKISHTALYELLDYKNKLNSYLITDQTN